MKTSCVPVLVTVALLLPLIFGAPESQRALFLGLPRVLTGDEPHYLVLINSVLLDGDLNVVNNYTAVHEGASQAGARFARYRFLDHHTVWFENGIRKYWFEAYEYDSTRWAGDSLGNPMPHLRAGVSAPMTEHPEYSIHPPGLALLIAPLLFPFRATPYIEPLSIVCSSLAIIVALFLFRSLLRKYNSDIYAVNLATAATFLGTPAWFYGRSLFTEPYLLLFVTGAYSCALRGKGPLIAGAFISLGMLLKPPFALLILPLCLMYLVQRKWLSAAFLLTPACLSAIIILYLNDIMFGSPWRASQEWLQGSFFTGAMGLLFSVRYGLVITTPIVLVVIVTWPSFLRSYPLDGIVLAAGVMVYFVFFASYMNWYGATCYGPRYLVPILPLLFVALTKVAESSLWQNRWSRYAVIATGILSISINGLAAMPYWGYWDYNPLLFAWHWSSGHPSKW